MQTETRSIQAPSGPSSAFVRGMVLLAGLGIAAGAMLASGPKGQGEPEVQGYVFLR